MHSSRSWLPVMVVLLTTAPGFGLAADDKPPRKVVLVELFTSQG